MARTGEVPLKVTPECKDLVKWGAGIYGETQAVFTERAVSTFLAQRRNETQALIDQGMELAESISAKYNDQPEQTAD